MVAAGANDLSVYPIFHYTDFCASPGKYRISTIEKMYMISTKKNIYVCEISRSLGGGGGDHI